MPTPAIRAYRASDRAAVRAIAFATGYMGDPVDWLWPDAESFADVITKYYTDQEPHSLLVAEHEARVVGYLTGCADSAKAIGRARREIARLVRRGALLRPALARFFWRSLFDLVRQRSAPREVLGDGRWPSHLHIDLLPEGRGRGLGRQLMEGWLAHLKHVGSPGVHLGTFAENARAIGFFERCGFERHGTPVRAPGFRTRAGAPMHAQWMVCSLA